MEANQQESLHVKIERARALESRGSKLFMFPAIS